MISRISFLLVGIAMLTNQAFAAVILTVAPVSVSYAPGTTNAGLNIFARTDAGTQDISGFDLKFDLQSPGGLNPGLGLPAGITFSAGFVTNPFFTTAGGFGGTSDRSTNPSSPLRDVYINGDGATATIGTTQTRLFTLNFDVGTGVPAGVYDLRFVTNQGAFGVYDGVGGDVALTQLNFGSLNIVTAVPEPSSMALLGLVMAGAAGIRHRARRKVRA